jgi:hypothetical protein
MQGRRDKKCEIGKPVTRMMTNSVLNGRRNTVEKHVTGDYAGIDVGAKSVVVSVRRVGRVVRGGSFAQTPEGHRALLDHPAGRVISRGDRGHGRPLPGLGGDLAPGRMAGGGGQAERGEEQDGKHLERQIRHDGLHEIEERSRL